VVITGGLGRLSSAKAKKLGGEALELRDKLIADEIDPKRMAIITGLKTTGDNVDFLLLWINTIFGFKSASIVVVEESYLIRRLRATMVGRLLKQSQINSATFVEIDNIFFVPTSTSSLESLSKIHGSKLVALSFLIGEVTRLQSYSDPKEGMMQLFPEWVANFDTPLEKQKFVTQAVDNLQTKLKSALEQVWKLMDDPSFSTCLAPTS